MFRFLSCLGLAFLAGFVGHAAQKPRPAATAATPAESLKVKEGFRVELLYTVPRDREGSWVSMCTVPGGKLIVCDQYGGLFLVTPPPLGGKPADTKVEKMPIDIGEAQGLLWAFDSLYVVVNRGAKYASGLYRVRDTDGDGALDKVELLRAIEGGGEHGPHAVLLTPDKKALTIVCGNQCKLMKPLSGTKVPKNWGEDHLLPRLPDGNGFMAGVMGPGGAIYRVDPEGKNWELISVGYRNQYDAAYNKQGELFTYDADMEWDFNTPWYRPTRINLVTPGSEYGWRNGAGKYPAYYPDNLPGIVNIGPGSPTGVVFGYGAKFPAKYQDALFICDWSYGKLYATHLKPQGSSYTGELEEFVTGTPLPLTDLVVNPADGALYFAIGGRRTQSGLYRVSYVGKESTAPSKPDDTGAEQRAIRHKLESFLGKQDPKAVEVIWPYLDHEDRFIRFAARAALEFQDVAQWKEKALSEMDHGKALTALLALVRVSAACPQHRAKDAPAVEPKLRGDIFRALEKIPYEKLDDTQQILMLRTYAIALNRLGALGPKLWTGLAAKLDAVYPSKSREQNAELCQLLVYLESDKVVSKTLKLLAEAPTQEEQMEYVRYLRMAEKGWTLEQRKEYFRWFVRAANFKGGNSFKGFMNRIKADAVAKLSPSDKVALQPILDEKPTADTTVIVGKPRKFVKKYTVAELVPIVEKGLQTKRDFDRGRRLFGEANCFSCHRYDNEGGAQAPDLTGVAGRFNIRDLLESTIEPSKVISDQYGAVIIVLDSGKTITGRIINLNADKMKINTDMADPNKLVEIDRNKIESQTESKVSMMPEGLIDTLDEGEIIDLMAYLLSRGDRKHKMFK
jgi:putative heme-binding domain-containing protein